MALELYGKTVSSRLLLGTARELDVALMLVTHDATMAARCDAQVHLVDGAVTTAAPGSSFS